MQAEDVPKLVRSHRGYKSQVTLALERLKMMIV